MSARIRCTGFLTSLLAALPIPATLVAQTAPPVSGGLSWDPVVGTNALVWTPTKVHRYTGGSATAEVKAGGSSIGGVQGIVRHPFLANHALIWTATRIYSLGGATQVSEV